MKRFKIITIGSLTVIFLMVALNIFYLHSLYDSLKGETLQSVSECVRKAYILEIIDRLRGSSRHGNDDSFIKLTLLIQGEKDGEGNYQYPNLFEKFENTMSSYFTFIAENDTTLPAIDEPNLNRILTDELSLAGLNPETVRIDPYVAESGRDDEDLWSVDFAITPDQEPVYTVRFSSMNGQIFSQMSGIVITSVTILLSMCFLIGYLLHWVGKLRSIEQMKDDFTHNMTHELKTPVAVAYSAADSMLRYYDQSDETRNKQFLKIIIQRLNFLSGMIENILSMSMERFRSLKLNKERLKLNPIVCEVVGMIELKADKPVNIRIDIPEGTEIFADQLHLGNIISNLLDNAVKYSNESVEIRIKGDNRSLTISDNGIGIDKSDLPYIFDKFYRVTDGDKYEAGGFGLGLFYVRQIVTLMGWEIGVESFPGKGTTFKLTFDGD